MLSCVPEKAPVDPSDPASEEQALEQEGKKRLYLRFDSDAGVFDNACFPVNFSSKTVIVNGISYTPQRKAGSGDWFVDAELSSFGVYVAYLIESDTDLSFYGENPTLDVLVPHVQFCHKRGDLGAIPLFAVFDSSHGSYLDFRPPYAVLDFFVPGSPVSLRLHSSTPSCGFLSWSRSDNRFHYGESGADLLLNCTGEMNSASGHYPVMVFGQDLKDVSLRVFNSDHTMFQAQLGDIDLEPGSYRRFNLDGRVPVGLIWYEGFDLCAWGGQVLEQENGFYPLAQAPGLSGDESLDGYEYATNTVDPAAAGSGFIQSSFEEQADPVRESHGMSDSYIRSRGFDNYLYMLRCRECPGYISVGTGNRGRGMFAMYPLGGIRAIKNLEVSFRLCIDPAADDDIQFLAEGSSAVIKEWTVDGVVGTPDSLSLKRTTSTLTMNADLLGGAGQWKTIRAVVDNCTDATAFKWMAASSESGNHGFYLDEICVREIPGGWNAQDCLRVLYWNIQNGMWYDQDDYGNFVEFVKRFSPDICVWCEARTNYETGTATWIPVEVDSYLPDHWAELASRYGHQYVGVSRRDKEAFPQVVTSRYPIEKLLQLGNVAGEAPILHGAGLFKVATPAGGYYFVTLHLNPNADADEDRLREITRIMEKTVLDRYWPSDRGWFVLGDFNSHSRKDAAFIDLPPDSPKYKTHDYIASETPLVDLVATRYPGKYISTTYGYSRFDYIYVDASTYSRVRNAGVITSSWTAPEPTDLSNFCIPSDHRPILVDIDY